VDKVCLFPKGILKIFLKYDKKAGKELWLGDPGWLWRLFVQVFLQGHLLVGHNEMTRILNKKLSGG